MGSVTFRGLQAGDIAYLAAHLREADLQELAASRGANVHPSDAISRAVLLSSHCWVAAGANPIAIFGIAPVSLLERIGSPWLLATDEAFEHPRALVTQGRRYIDQMRRSYSRLFNYVDARNDKSIRWLRRLGFVMQPAEPYGVEGEPFHRFEMRTE